jgi:hypothetical protein
MSKERKTGRVPAQKKKRENEKNAPVRGGGERNGKRSHDYTLISRNRISALAKLL